MVTSWINLVVDAQRLTGEHKVDEIEQKDYVRNQSVGGRLVVSLIRLYRFIIKRIQKLFQFSYLLEE